MTGRGPKFLYTSEEVHRAIKRILGNPQPRDRRVVLVAYLGAGAEAYLPDPAGMTIICNPEPGATRIEPIQRLLSRGAEVQFSDRLHMKVYWSDRRGCVVTSANASTNALGRGALKEVGVLWPRGAIQLRKLIHYARPRAITVRDLQWLARAADRAHRGIRGTSGDSEAPLDFLTWAKAPDLRPIKLGWWGDNGDFAANSLLTAKARYGVKEPNTFVNCRKGEYRAGDWVLKFEVSRGNQIEWMYVDFVVKVRRGDKAYEASYPYQAVQVHGRSRLPDPPFEIDGEFRMAFRRAVAAYGSERLQAARSAAMPKRFLGLIRRHYQID